MTDSTLQTATPDVEVLSGPTPSGSSQTNGHTSHSTESKITSEKRKADDASTTNDKEGSKDLVESKQTTLDDIVQQESKVDQNARSEAEERKVEEEKDRPTKKAKIDTEAGTPKKGEDVKVTAAATPPAQKSHQDAPGDRPHKSVKKVDDLKDKPTVSTPTKSSQPDGDVEMPTTSSPPAAEPQDKPGATSAAGENDSSTVPGDEAHLDHPENWTTGDDPATDKQKGYLKVLEKQKGVPMGDVETMGKSEASEKIENAVPATSTDPKPAVGAAPPAPTNGADDSSTVPGDEAHLDHPENWTTGGDPATDKQKGFLKVLEKQKGVSVGDVSGIGKSEASEKIDELKNM